MSELIVTILLIICFLLIFGLYRYLDKIGLSLAIVILNIITFVLTFKITILFKMNINLGIVPYIVTMSIIYLSMIKNHKKDIKELIIISLITNIITALLITIMNSYIPAITETISINMADTFEYNYKILIIYPIIMFISQYAIIKLYLFIASIQENIPIAILLTYIITGPIYTIVFYMLCYIAILPLKQSIFIGITTYIAGLVITLITIAFLRIISDKKVIK